MTAAGLALATPAYAQDGTTVCNGASIGWGSSVECNINVSNGSITSEEIKDGTITGRDVKNGSLTGDDIRNGSIKGEDIKDGTITGRDVRDGSLTGRDIKNGSITGDDIKDGSVKKRDLSWHVRNQIDEATETNEIQDGRLDTLDGRIGDAQQAISAHSALLSQHSKRLDEQEKGIAIALSMPDAWLSDKDRFAIAGNIGGFNGETALGFAGIGRINQTWSLNSKIGTDVEFKQFGWSVGARAGW